MKVKLIVTIGKMTSEPYFQVMVGRGMICNTYDWMGPSALIELLEEEDLNDIGQINIIANGLKT